MKTLLTFVLPFFLIAASFADETLYRYEGDIHPLDPIAGWQEFNPCDPPCSDYLEDGHFVRLWSEAADFTNYHLQVAEPPDPPPRHYGSKPITAPTFRWGQSSLIAMGPFEFTISPSPTWYI